MRVFHWALVIILALSAVGESRADVSVNEAFRQYDKESEGDRLAIARMIGSMYVAFGAANAELRELKIGPLYCEPASLDTSQVIEVLRQHVRKNSRFGQFPVGFMLLKALRERYPCK